MTPSDVVAQLRALLGERRFRKFVLAVRERVGESRLHFWQDAVLDELAASTSFQVPRRPDDLAPLLEGLVDAPPVLAKTEVPSWLTVEFLGGECPVQGWGTCGGWSWYFRARGEQWTISASDGSVDAIDVDATSDVTFYYEEEYAFGVSQYDAGYMSHDEARHYIVRELSRLRVERGIG
jgi:hypothetical protein